MKLFIEIRAAEGGQDAKLLVPHQAAIYQAYATRVGARATVSAHAPGWLHLELEGSEKALTPLLLEGGGHRWQRVPPTERKGRVLASTVTVAVFEGNSPALPEFNPADVELRFTKDSGPGGQHRNKTESCVVATHRPTGLQAKASSKCQHQNRRAAMVPLEERVPQAWQERADDLHAGHRKAQVGSGQRGDKVRTYREQDDRVLDHRTARSARLSALAKGGLVSLLAM
jgi:peptide chain release factor 1